MIDGFKGKSYEERIKLIGGMKLEDRAIRADMIEMYKIINKIEDVKVKNFFRLEKGITREHRHKLFKKRVKLDVAKFSNGTNCLKKLLRQTTL